MSYYAWVSIMHLVVWALLAGLFVWAMKGKK